MISEEKLVADYLGGEETAFEEILARHLKPVFNFLCRICGDRTVAEDLAQDTFFKVWKNLKKFDPEKKFRTWLFAIAKNTAFDYLKKKKEIPFSMFTDEEGENWLENIAGDDFLPEEILERKDLAEELDQKLQKLQPHYRAILLLHYKEDFSLQEIAEILDEPYNTVKSRHQRGLGRLKKAISD